VRDLPRRLGAIALPVPLAPGAPGPAPRAIWNNAGRPDSLGAPTLPSMPGPTLLFAAPSGARRAITFTLQGARNRRAAVTNGVVVVVIR
jgi:hypothetical protein